MVLRTRQDGTGGAPCFCLMHSRTRNIYASPLPDAWLLAFVTYSTTRSTGPASAPSVLTCIVTALSTIGTSLQAQFLRLAGFVAGGLVLGISAQILILPAIDSIFGFALFFAAGTAIAAWFATSSPRLSFFGVQIALAFYFVNLQDFQIQTDLTIARDKVVGVLLGILAMGFIFDRFGTKSDVEQLQKLLVRNVRMLAQLGVCPVVARQSRCRFTDQPSPQSDQ